MFLLRRTGVLSDAVIEFLVAYGSDVEHWAHQASGICHLQGDVGTGIPGSGKECRLRAADHHVANAVGRHAPHTVVPSHPKPHSGDIVLHPPVAFDTAASCVRALSKPSVMSPSRQVVRPMFSDKAA